MELADRNRFAIVWEILKGAMGTGIVLHNDNWFGAAMPGLHAALLSYFVVSVAVTGWFVWKHAEEEVSGK